MVVIIYISLVSFLSESSNIKLLIYQIRTELLSKLINFFKYKLLWALLNNNLHFESNDLQKFRTHLLFTSQDLQNDGFMCRDVWELILFSYWVWTQCVFGWGSLPVYTGNCKSATLEVSLQRLNLRAINEKLEENRGKNKIIF